MDIYQFAMEKEKFAENYYREAAEKVQNEGLKRILNLLADEEVQHYHFIEKMKSQTPEVADSSILTASKDVFAGMKESKDTFGVDDAQVEIFQKAQEFEENSRTYYEEKAQEVSDPAQKDIFMRLAAQEKKHFILLENIIEFLKKPETWLEDAEFYHIEEY